MLADHAGGGLISRRLAKAHMTAELRAAIEALEGDQTGCSYFDRAAGISGCDCKRCESLQSVFDRLSFSKE